MSVCKTETVHGIELFSGMGVSLTGLRKYIHMYEAYEKESDPAKSLKMNHSDVLVRKKNIFDITFSKKDSDVLIFPYEKSLVDVLLDKMENNDVPHRFEFLKSVTSKRNRPPILISGGPPCQPYSNLNTKKDPDDPRIQAVNQFFRLVGELDPEYVVFENIPRIYKHIKMWIIQFLKQLGYNVYEGYESSELYGDPQVRKRYIIIASKRGYAIPKKTHGTERGLKPIIPASTFLGKSNDGTEIGITSSKLIEINELLRSSLIKSNNWTRFVGRKWDTIHIVYPNEPIKAVTNPSKLYYMYFDEKTNSVTRKLNFNELKGAFGLNQDYKIFGNNTSIAQQLANSNTIGMCEAIGKTINLNYNKYY